MNTVKENIIYYINYQSQTHIFKLNMFYKFFTKNHNKKISMTKTNEKCILYYAIN